MTTLHRKVLRDDARLAKQGGEVVGDTPDQFRAFVKRGMERPDPRRQYPAGLTYAAANNVAVIAR